MQLRYTVDVTVDPSEIDGLPSEVVGDEIKSNLESVDYVRSYDVQPSPRSSQMPTEQHEPTEGFANRPETIKAGFMWSSGTENGWTTINVYLSLS